MRTTAALLGAGALVAATAGLALPASAQEDTAQVSVLHGIPDSALGGDATVDVYVNGDETLPDFMPGDLEGPLSLPAGSYEVAISANDAGLEGAVLTATLDVSAGMNYTAVAHLDADGSPKVTPFVNNTEAVAAGSGTLVARHVAQAPEVEVFVNGDSVGSFSNPNEIGPAPLAAGSYDVEIQAGGAAVPTTPATDAVPVEDGVSTIAYAWGTADDLQVAVQTVSLGHSAPAGVPGGQTGDAAGMMSGWIFAAAGLGIAGIALSGRRFAATSK